MSQNSTKITCARIVGVTCGFHSAETNDSKEDAPDMTSLCQEEDDDEVEEEEDKIDASATENLNS